MDLSKPNFLRTTILIGGSFDPLHLGHLALAKAAQDLLGTSAQVLFVPCYQSPGKPLAHADAPERLRLLKIGLSGTPYSFWDFELNRPHSSYTIDTLREAARLGAQKQQLYLVLGADSYHSLATWREAAKLRDYAQILIAARPGYLVQLESPEDKLLPFTPRAISSREIRAALAKNTIPEKALPASLEQEFHRLLLNSRNSYAK